MKMLFSGVALLFGSFSHLILILMWSEGLFWYRVTHVGAFGSPLSNIHPLYWVIVLLELVVSVALIVLGMKERSPKGERSVDSDHSIRL